MSIIMEGYSLGSSLPQDNPELKPLEDLKVVIKSDGTSSSKTIPALDKHWVIKRSLLFYDPPIFENPDGQEIIGAKEHWLEIVSYMIDDLLWLLKLPHFRFWSNVIYNPEVMRMLTSFLQEAPPFYALDNFPNDTEVREKFNELRRYVLIVFARLVTNKESPSEYMNRSFQGNLLYENYIFTIPTILDISQQYGRDNRKTVEKLLQSLFTLQPLYIEDLRGSVEFFIQVFATVEQRFGEKRIIPDYESILLSDKDSEEISLTHLEDLIVHVLDLFSNIAIFLENYPLAAEVFQREDFMAKIVSFYSNTIPKMYIRLRSLTFRDETMPKYIELKHRIDISRVESLKLYRSIVYKSVRDIIERRNDGEEGYNDAEIKRRQIENYLDFISQAISEREFITDYNRFYSVNSDLEILSQVCPEIDGIKCDYILNSIQATIIKDKERPSKNNSRTLAGPSIRKVNAPPSISENVISTLSSRESLKATKPSETEINYLILEVKEILCHLGEGFIERCLKHYNYESASVINAVLEDSLPPNLKEIDTSLPYIPPDPEELSAEVDVALNRGVQRLNVFDNDEFDVMTNDKLDTTRVHRGKRKDKYKDLNQMLNDKTDKKSLEHIYKRYSLIPSEYDDEYDDTYDSQDIGGSAQDDTLEIDRPFTTPRVLFQKEKIEEVCEEECPEEFQEERVNRDCFVQNPAELREKAEQRRKLCQRGALHNSKRDVVGNSRGQGQEKSVLVNRDNKNINKASRANHNRRAGSQWKRRQGMVPS